MPSGNASYKFSYFLAAAIAMSLNAGMVSSAHAEPSTTPPKQDSPQRTQLNLTQEQKDKIVQIRQQTRTKIQAVLTSTQRDILKAAIENGQNSREIEQSLNLTEAQKAKIGEIIQSSQQQMFAILTPEQQQLIQNSRK